MFGSLSRYPAKDAYPVYAWEKALIEQHEEEKEDLEASKDELERLLYVEKEKSRLNVNVVNYLHRKMTEKDAELTGLKLGKREMQAEIDTLKAENKRLKRVVDFTSQDLDLMNDIMHKTPSTGNVDKC